MTDPRHQVQVIQTLRPLGRSGPELRPRFMWLTQVEVTQACTWAAHQHAHYEIIVVRRGRYRCRVNGHACTLSAGEALVVRPGDVHEDVIAPPLTYAAINLMVAGGSLFHPAAPVSTGHLTAASGEWWASVERLAEECRRAIPDAAVLDALCAELLRRILRAVPAEHLALAWVRPADEAFTTRLQTVFTAHQGRTVPVAVLARACGLGVRAFTAQCRAATGLPPAKALLRHRCELAVRLLHDGHSVAATAEQLGFASQFHFSRAFKRHLGESPSRLR